MHVLADAGGIVHAMHMCAVVANRYGMVTIVDVCEGHRTGVNIKPGRSNMLYF